MLTTIVGTFTEIIQWIIGALKLVVGLFWEDATSTLTFFGILAIAALGISIFFLLMRVVQNFLHFRA